MTSIELREIAALRAGLEPPGQLDIVQLGRRPTFTEDEYQLGTLGYRQNFLRGLGLFENLAATFTTMNYVSAMPSLFVFAMITGGPAAALVNWIVVGVLAFITSLAMAEIAAVYPTAGGELNPLLNSFEILTYKFQGSTIGLTNLGVQNMGHFYPG
jgi:hypothetical protein